MGMLIFDQSIASLQTALLPIKIPTNLSNRIEKMKILQGYVTCLVWLYYTHA